MKTKIQLENKISELEYWLKANPNHFDYAKILKDKKELEEKIIKKDYAPRTDT